MKISVIIPVYNSAKWLNRCLKSICNQSYSSDNYEVIIINDGSTDESENLILAYQKEYPGIIKYYYQTNKGVSAARNKGIELANAEWITFIDSDDWVEDTYLESFNVDNIIDVDGVFKTYLTYREGNNSFLKETFIKNEILSPQELIVKYPTTPYYSTPYVKLFKCSIIAANQIRFNEKLSFGEDTIFVLEYLSYCKKVATLKISDYHYVFNNNGLSKLMSLDIKKELYLFNLLVDVFENKLKINKKLTSIRIKNNTAKLIISLLNSEKSLKSIQKRQCLLKLFKNYKIYFLNLYKYSGGKGKIFYILLKLNLFSTYFKLVEYTFNKS